MMAKRQPKHLSPVTGGESSTENIHEVLVDRIEVESKRAIERLEADLLLLKSDRPMCDTLEKANGY